MGGGLYLTSARLKFEVVAKLCKLDAVNAQFQVDLELYFVSRLGVWMVAESEVKANSVSN